MSVPATTEELQLADPFEVPVDPGTVPLGIRAQMAFDLRKAGASYDLIAEKLGYKNGATAEQAIRRVLASKYEADDVEHVVQMELARLDALQLVAWRRAKDGDLAAIDRILKIMERRSQYLGLDRQAKTSHGEVHNQTVVMIGGNSEEYTEQLRQLRDQARQKAIEG